MDRGVEIYGTRFDNSLLVQNSLTYATRVRTIKNDVTKNEANKDILKLRRIVDFWKDKAGLPPEQRQYVDLEDIKEERQPRSQTDTPPISAESKIPGAPCT